MPTKQSGVNIWLQEQIIDRLGNDRAQQIIEEARTHETNRYSYMIGVLDTLGHTDIGQEYRRKQNADQRERYIRNSKRHLKGYKLQLAECTNPGRCVWLQNRIQRIEEYLKKAEEERKDGIFSCTPDAEVR